MKPLLALGAVALVLAALVLEAPGASAAREQKIFEPLRAALRDQGVPEEQVQGLLAAPELEFEAGLLARLLSTPERRLNYGQFLGKRSLRKARRFLEKYAATLRQTQQATGVPPAVVVAILTVESRLGSYIGRHSTLNVLASQAVLDTPLAQAELVRRWPHKRRQQLPQEKMQQRLARRAAWARQELVALLRLAQRQKRSPWKFRGSPAGALGMAQFMPSSALKWGVDGDADGSLDLEHPVDAIHSVANYLQAHGWRPGMGRQEQIKVILTYNHSTPYARTVLELARRLA